MKMTITEKDLERIYGRFTIQVDIEDSISLSDRKIDLDFYLTKRVRFVTTLDGKIIESDFWGNCIIRDKDKYIEMFNNYLGDSKGTRYHRLLYAEELKIVFKFMAERNY